MMTANVIKLESFTTVSPIVEPTTGRFFQEDIDRAREEGIIEGFNQCESQSAALLCDALQSLGKALEINQEQRETLYTDAVTALIPILSEIVDALSPTKISSRLECSLTAELNRLANIAEPVSVRIGCDEALRETVEKCVAQSGISGMELDVVSTGGISLSHTGGNIRFSQEKITQEIRKLIEEIKEQ